MKKILCFLGGHLYGGVPPEIYYYKEWYEKKCDRCGKIITVRNSRNVHY